MTGSNGYESDDVAKIEKIYQEKTAWEVRRSAAFFFYWEMYKAGGRAMGLL